jgi:predicted nucleotide-binding protein (sugar kinase/HSP70/actin superfamily)
MLGIRTRQARGNGGRLIEGGPGTKVGLPMALLAYKYYLLWKTFLSDLGCEVIESPPTNKAILFEGVKATVDDICIPVKAFIGHLLYLKDKGVDAVLVPRVYSIERSAKPRFTCPKLMGLPDMARALVGEPPVLLDADHHVRERSVEQTFVEIGSMIGFKRRASLAAYKRAALMQARFEGSLAVDGAFASAKNGAPPSTAQHPQTGGLQVALIAHPYLLFDELLSFSIERRLRDLGARVINQYSVSTDVIEAELTQYREVSWSYERELLGAASHFMGRQDVDGIVFLTSFGCGTFAVVSELIEREVRQDRDKPVLYLMVDELTGEGGIQTRIESFCDMISYRKVG